MERWTLAVAAGGGMCWRRDDCHRRHGRLVALLIAFSVELLLRGGEAATAGIVLFGGDAATSDPSRTLAGPMKVEVRPGNLLVTDTNNGRVAQCTGTSCITIAGGMGRGSGADQLRSPYGAVASKTNTAALFVADTLNNRIQRFGFDEFSGKTIIGATVSSLGSTLVNPSGIALDNQRMKLYVCDTGNHRVLRFQLTEFFTANGTSETVAGIFQQNGPGLQQLDNPLGLYLDEDTQSIWVADTRNHRIVRWDEGATEGVLVANVSGRPYNVKMHKSHNATYFVDRDNCVVWKRMLSGGPVSIVAGTFGDCGSGLSQLRAPAGVDSLEDGSIIVADSDNNRIVQWTPEPLVNTFVCILTGTCRMNFTGGNPLRGNGIVVLKADSTLKPGDKCRMKNCQLANATGGADFSLVSTQAETMTIQDATYNIGVPTNGVLGVQYQVCWGSKPDKKAILAGDCSSTIYEAGTLEFRGLVYAGYFEMRCAVGERCLLKVRGFALTEDSFLMLAPKPIADYTQFYCGFYDPVFRAFDDNYRLSIVANPAKTFLLTRQEGAVVELDFDLGAAQGTGLFKMCLCAAGTRCIDPKDFDYDAGSVELRGASGKQVWKCVENDDCNITVRGMFLNTTDMIWIGPYQVPCGEQTDLMYKKRAKPFANVMWSPDDLSYEWQNRSDMISLVSFELGDALAEGRYRVCYCPTVSIYSDNNPLNPPPCFWGGDFLEDAGIIEVRRIEAANFRCAMGEACSIGAEGHNLNGSADFMLVQYKGLDPCGLIWPAKVDEMGVGNSYAPSPKSNSTVVQNFSLWPFKQPGVFNLCYCAGYKEVDLIPQCLGRGDYFQVAGLLYVRGPEPYDFSCIANESCFVDVPGTELDDEDRLQLFLGVQASCPGNNTPVYDASWVYPEVNSTSVSAPTAAAILEPYNKFAQSVKQPGFVAPLAPLNGTQPPLPMTAPWDVVKRYSVGRYNLGAYTVCYCARVDGPDPGTKVCDSPGELWMRAGVLKVRGPNPGSLFNCVVMAVCQVIVSGFDLLPKDWILVTSVDQTCGTAGALTGGELTPVAITQALPRMGSDTERYFKFGSAAIAGHYRVCYCTALVCNGNEDFHQDAGVLFIKGLSLTTDVTFCASGADCSYKLLGYGLLLSTDALMLVPWNFDCGGAQLRIVGGSGNEWVMNGLYYKQKDSVDGRAWYLQANPSTRRIFYDIFDQRWILGSATVADVPEKPGWGWIYAPNAMTPNRVSGAWQVWDPLARPPSGYQGDWDDMSPNVMVVGSQVTGAVEGNPTNSTTEQVADDILGSPFLLQERFQFGIASQVGAYRLCFCASMDSDDLDNIPCNDEREFDASIGVLIVHSMKLQERYQCTTGQACEVRSYLPGSLYSQRVEMVLIPFSGGSDPGGCHALTKFPTQGSFPGKVGGRTIGETRATPGIVSFKIGVSSDVMSYTVCVCANYKLISYLGGGVDVCSLPAEFFEHIGTLRVAPSKQVTVDYGSTVLVNFTRGGFLSSDDRAFVAPGYTCDVSTAMLGAFNATIAPVQVSDNNAWLYFVFPPPKARGPYRLCFCAAWDGPDADSLPCDSADEFYMEGTWVTVSAVTGLYEVAQANGTATFRLVADENSSASGNSSSLLPLDRDPKLALSLQEALRKGLSAMLFEGNKLSVTVSELTVTRLPGARRLQDARRLAAANFTAEVFVRFLMQLSAPLQLQTPPGGCPLPPADESGFTCLELALRNTTILVNQVASYMDFKSMPSVFAYSVLNVIPQRVSMAESWPTFQCLRGINCTVGLEANNELTPHDMLLVIDGGDGVCGATTAWRADTVATARASEVFGMNPASVDATTSGPETRYFRTGQAKRLGFYSLCYCWAETAPCVVNSDYYQVVGEISVVGVSGVAALECQAQRPCSVEVVGAGLSAFDQLVVVGEDVICGSPTIPIAGFVFNPVSSGGDYSSTLLAFNLGMATIPGVYTLCLCFSAWRPIMTNPMEPCTSIVDYSSLVGILAVRGPRLDTPHVFGCPLAAPEVEVPCTLPVVGQGLWPSKDAVLIVRQADRPCGLAEGVSTITTLMPNPIFVDTTNTLKDWPVNSGSFSIAKPLTASATWSIQASLEPGNYRACWCTARPSGVCLRPIDYEFTLGQLTIAGAKSTGRFTCKDKEWCTFNVSGNALLSTDRLAVISPGSRCGKADAAVGVIEVNPLAAAIIDPNGTWAYFDLGILQADGGGAPMSFSLCYCAHFDLDGDGIPCNNRTEFTHSAGLLSTLVCASTPNATITPPVEDVYGEFGDPHVSFYAIPNFACLEDLSKKQSSVTSASVRLAYPVPESGRAVVNQTSVLAQRKGHCAGGTLVEEQHIFKSTLNQVFFGIKPQQDGATLSFTPIGSDDRAGSFPLTTPLTVAGQGFVLDLAGKTWICPAWQVPIITKACTPWFGWMFGLACHAAIAIPVFSRFVLVRCAAVIRGVRRVFQSSSTKLQGLKGLRGTTEYLKVKAAMFPSDEVENGFEAVEAVMAAYELQDKITTLMSRTSFMIFLAVARVALVIPCLVVVQMPLSIQGPVAIAMVVLTIVLQLIIACCTRARPTLYSLLGSIATVAKLHLDLFLEPIAIANHCEYWRVAGLAVIVCVLFVQVFWPSFALLLAIRSPRRVLKEGSLVGLQHLLLPVTMPVLQPIGTSRKSKKDQKVDVLALEDAEKQSPKSQGSPSEVGMQGSRKTSQYSPDLEQEKSLWGEARIQLKHWYTVTCGPSQSVLPEEERWRRLFEVAFFFEKCGWFLGDDVCRHATRYVGFDPGDVRGRWVMLRLFCGGVDITALQFLVLVVYVPRLVQLEVATLLLAVLLGLVSTIRCDVSRYMLEIKRTSILLFVFLLAASTLLRLFFIVPMVGGGFCPHFSGWMLLWISTVLLVWSPCLALLGYLEELLFMRAPAKKIESSNKVAARPTSPLAPTSPKKNAALRRKGSGTLVKTARRMTFAQFQGEEAWGSSAEMDEPILGCVRALLEESTAQFSVLHQQVDNLNALEMLDLAAFEECMEIASTLQSQLAYLGRAFDLLERREGFVEVMRLVEKAEATVSSNKILEKNARPSEGRQAVLGCVPKLKLLAIEELRWARLAAASVFLLRSPMFQVGNTSERMRLAKELLPVFPEMQLVWWREMLRPGKISLPTPTQTHRLISAAEAYGKYGKDCVIVFVAHRWRSRDNADTYGAFARQLTEFAQYYRRTWGETLELFYWVDYSCRPSSIEVGDGSEAWGSVYIDALLPVIVSVCDMILVCECEHIDTSSWVRTELSLSYCFAPAGRFPYIVTKNFGRVAKRNEVEETQAQIAKRKQKEMMENIRLQAFKGRAFKSKESLDQPPPTYLEVFFKEAADNPFDSVLDKNPPLRTVAMRKLILHDPMAIDADKDERGITSVDRPRLARLVRLCKCGNASELSGDGCRTRLEYDQTQISLRRIDAVVRDMEEGEQSASAAHLQKLFQANNWENNSEEGPPQVEDIVDVGKIFTVIRPGTAQEHTYPYEERSLEEYLRQPDGRALEIAKVNTSVNRDSASRQANSPFAPVPVGSFTMTSWSTVTSRTKTPVSPLNTALREAAMVSDPVLSFAPLEPFPRPARFHDAFVTKNVRLGQKFRTVERVEGLKGSGGGGVVVTEGPLQKTVGVCPQEPLLDGIVFEVKVIRAIPSDREGLAIGFTTQDPEAWPTGHPAPMRANRLANAWLCGYDGRWCFEKRIQPIRTGSWKPSELEGNDVVTIAAVGHPMSLLRVFVNGNLVAEERFGLARFPDPFDTPLWGIVDLNGSCMKVSLTEAPPDGPALRKIDVRPALEWVPLRSRINEE